MPPDVGEELLRRLTEQRVTPPKEADRLARFTQRDRRLELEDPERFDIREFLMAHPDPFRHFSDNTQPMSRLYRK